MQATQQATSRPATNSRALSARTAMASPVERAYAQGATPVIRKTDRAVMLTVPGKTRKIALVKGDGTVTPEGTTFYNLTGVPAPMAFPYEQPLLHGKWVQNFDGSRTMVRRMNAQQEWVPTKAGANYFKYNRETFEATIPTFEAHPRDSVTLDNGLQRVLYWVNEVQPRAWTMTTAQIPDSPLKELTTGHIRATGRLATIEQREEHARQAIEQWIGQCETLRDINNREWHVVWPDSPCRLVHDHNRPIIINWVRSNVYDQQAPTADTLLQRPMAAIAVPDGCWRSYDLHPGTFQDTGMCVVHMIHTSFVTSKMVRVGKTFQRIKEPAQTIEEIVAEMDRIFARLYTVGAFPYEHGWRQDGCTPIMVEQFCRTHDIKYIARQNRRILKTYTPPKANNHTPTIHFSIFGSHAYWYGKPPEAPSDKRPAANNSAAQRGSKRKTLDFEENQTSDVDFEQNPEEYRGGTIQGRELKPLFGQDKVPPFSEWKDEFEMDIAMCNDWEPFRTKRDHNKRRRTGGEKLYIWTHDIESIEERLREAQQQHHNFDVRTIYGQGPDDKTRLIVDAGYNVPTMVVVKIPREHKILQQICKHVTTAMELDPGAMVYKGQTKAQIGERLRLILSKARRTQLNNEQANHLLVKQCLKCNLCGCALEKRMSGSASVFQVDHIRPLSDGGVDESSNMQCICLPCHAQKTNEERLGTLYTKPLYSRFNRDALEGFVAAPKPRQLVVGNGKNWCVEIDAVQCRSNALAKNTVPLPVFHIVDNFQPHEPGKAADFYYIDAGLPLEDPVLSLPYFGPGWYWCENYMAIMQAGTCSRGKITDADVICTFTASQHEPPDTLSPILIRMTELVNDALTGFETQPQGSPPFTPEEPMSSEAIRNTVKGIILSMLGTWTQQHHYSWSCIDSSCPDDAIGPIHMTRGNVDRGTMRLMSKTETLSPVSMFPIGLIALHKEHLVMWQLKQALTAIPHKIHGAINDCFLLTHKRGCVDKLKTIVESVTHADGSAVFRVKMDGANPAFKTAPIVKWTHRHNTPVHSSWAFEQPDDMPNEPRFSGSFGFWLRSFIAVREWKFIKEDEGVGRGAHDTYQAEIVPKIVNNRGAFISGRGGTGKSHVIALLKKEFENEGFTVHVIALTHTAVANATSLEDNVKAQTIMHTLYTIMQTTKRTLAIIVDEASQIPLAMQSTLLSLKWMGHIIVQMGDFAGQFMPIPDQARQHLLENLDTSPMMHDMCNGLHITMNKYRRGTDKAHYDYVGSLYPHTGITLEDAIEGARERYPARGHFFEGVQLCISHRSRTHINKMHNEHLDKYQGTLVKCPGKLNHTDNQPQDMWLRTGMILMAIMKNSSTCKNGARYKLLTIAANQFQFCRVTDDDETTGESFTLTTKETGEYMRLTYAVTYFSSQGRTIYSPLRLTDTTHKYFTLRHLRVGLGRAPEGSAVQVE